MKSQLIPFCGGLDFSSSALLSADIYRWAGNGYTPKTEIRLCYNERAIKAKLTAYEPETACKETEDNGRVWCDSCLEMFLMPYPEDRRYLNIEVNPLGAMIFSVGENYRERIPLVFRYKNRLGLSVETDAEKGCWSVTFELPFALLTEIYNRPGKPRRMAANFYKCGDETPCPHFGMWNEVLSETPQFHLPQYFGEIILCEPNNESNILL